jgi:hypothetical protein
LATAGKLLENKDEDKNYRQAAKNAKGRPKNWQERFLLVLSPFSRPFLLSSLSVLGALAVKMVGHRLPGNRSCRRPNNPQNPATCKPLPTSVSVRFHAEEN